MRGDSQSLVERSLPASKTCELLSQLQGAAISLADTHPLTLANEAAHEGLALW